MFEGVHTALITPFAGESIDFDALAGLVELQVQGGVAGIVPCGTTGESATLSVDERTAIYRATVKAAAGRCLVLGGAGSGDTRTACKLAVAAAEAGADGILVNTPPYNKPTQEGLFRHFEAIAQAAPGLPIMLYNIPGRTAVNLTVETIARLAEIPEVVALKEATADMAFAANIVNACGDRLTLLSGDDATALPLWAVGGRGVVSVISNLLPARMVALWDAFAGGDWATARAEHLALMPLFQGLFIETNPAPIKALVARATGLGSDAVRLPLVPVTPAALDRLTTLCAALGLRLEAAA